MTLWRIICSGAAFLYLVCGASFTAQSGSFVTPEKGSTERAAIMNAVRVPVEKALSPKVVFVVDQLFTGEGWAFLSGRPQRPSGAAIDYRLTPYAEDYAAGLFDDGVAALLAWQDGRWQVRALSIGHTDVVWETWPQDFGAPPGVFGR
ncbi:MAG: hypothetical protein AAFV45_10065 [Pseudomonadota bacterium]